jgi:hypothetical protein
LNAAPPAIVAIASPVRGAPSLDSALEIGRDHRSAAPNRSRPLYNSVLSNADTPSVKLLDVLAHSAKTKTTPHELAAEHAAAFDEALSQMTESKWPKILAEIGSEIC